MNDNSRSNAANSHSTKKDLKISPLEPRILLSATALDFDGDGEHLEGSEHDDELTGSDAADSILGLGGDDLIHGGDGDDVIEGDGASLSEKVLSENLLVNGDFQSGRTGHFRTGSAEGWDATDGWEIHKASVYGRSNEGHDRVFELDAYKNTRIGQSVEDLEEGENLLLTLDAAQRTVRTNEEDGFDVYWNGELVDRVNRLGNWQRFEYNVQAGSGNGANRLEIQGTGPSNSYGTIIDNVSLQKFVNASKVAPSGDDEIWAGDGDDSVRGNEGNDEIHGGGGNDKLSGDAGDDYIAGNSGDDQIFGGDGNDKIYGSSGSDELVGQAGNDRLSGGTGDDKAVGGDGNDLIYGGDGSDTLYGNSGNDRIYGSDGDDVLIGGEGNDRLSAGDDNDVVDGGAGDDFVYGGAGDDKISGGAGRDRLSAGDGDDVVRGGDDDDEIYGSAGEDFVYGDGGNDNVSGGDGNDFVYGHEGDDELTGNSGDDELFGGAGNDEIWGDTPGTPQLVVSEENLAAASEFELGPTVRENGPAFEGLMEETLDADELVRVDRGLLFGADGDFVIDAGDSPTDLKLEFVGGQAGHRNIVGWYNIDETGQPSNPQILKVMTSGIFGQAKDSSMGSIEGATGKIGFFIMDNGASSGKILKAIDKGYEMQFSDKGDDGDIDSVRFLNSDGKTRAEHKNIFFSTTSLNHDGKDHVIAGKDTDGNIVVGFEDLPNNGDNDFDDFVFKIVGHNSQTTFDLEDSNDFEQTFHELSAGDNLRVSFDVSDRFGDEEQGGGLQVLWNGEVVHEVTDVASVQTTNLDLSAIDGANHLEIKAIGLGGKVSNFSVHTLEEVIVPSDDAPGDDVLHGGDGNDEMHGNGGDDVLFGDDGDDYLAGNDGNDELHGGDGDDTAYGGQGNDSLNGGVGNDRLSAGDGNDVVRGDEGDDEIYGSQGEDELFGDTGSDKIYGGTENDRLSGGEGDDRLSAGDGDDYIDGGDGDDVVYGGDGVDIAHGGAGNDRLSMGNGNDTAIGGEGDDEIYGSAGKDFISGGDGNDRAYGGTDSDFLSGGAGKDRLSGGDGDDVLTGGQDDDTIIGGDGVDTAFFDGELSRYVISYDANGRIVVRDSVGSDGEDTLISVEKLQFGSRVIDINDLEEYINSQAVTPTVAEDTWVEIPEQLASQAQSPSNAPAPADSPAPQPRQEDAQQSDVPPSNDQPNPDDVVVIESAPTEGFTDWEKVDFGELTEIFPE